MTGAGFYKYWAKASKEDNRYHLLPYYCLDVAAEKKITTKKTARTKTATMQSSAQSTLVFAGKAAPKATFKKE